MPKYLEIDVYYLLRRVSVNRALDSIKHDDWGEPILYQSNKTSTRVLKKQMLSYTFVAGKDYGPQTLNPSNQCQWCDLYDSTARANSAWSNRPAVACDDQDSCTHRDTCNAGRYVQLSACTHNWYDVYVLIIYTKKLLSSDWLRKECSSPVTRVQIGLFH